MSLELLSQLFNTDIFLIQEKGKSEAFCLAEKPADKTAVLILLNEEPQQTLSPASLESLLKIADFKEYHLTRDQIRVLNLNNQNTTFLELQKEFSALNIICFGVEPAEIGLQIETEQNKVIRFMGINLVFTSSLDEISKNEKLKRQFFIEALKPLFTRSNSMNK